MVYVLLYGEECVRQVSEWTESHMMCFYPILLVHSCAKECVGYWLFERVSPHNVILRRVHSTGHVVFNSLK